MSYIQLSYIRGNSCQNDIFMHQDDFYTLCMKKIKQNKLKNNHRQDFNIIFNKKNVDVDYLCSDFVRFCLALYKNNPQLSSNNMSIIPKQPIPISKELQEYMEDYLPDYYDIRTNRK